MKIAPLLFMSLRLFWGFFTGKSGGKQIRGAVIGLAISFIPVILVIIVANGMIQGITQRYMETSSYHIQVFPPNELDEGVFPLLEEEPTVQGIFPERQGFGLLYEGNQRQGVTIRGIDQNLLQDQGFMQFLEVAEGEAVLENPEDLLVGKALAQELGLRAGDSVKVLTARTLRGRYLPRVSTFKVRGIVSVGYQELDGLWVFCDLSRANSILPGREYSTFIGLKVSDPFVPLEPLVESLLEKLPFGYRVYDWSHLNRRQYQSFEATRILLLVIMIFIIFVSAFNLASSLLMVGLERQKELSILKSMGAKGKDLGVIFFLLGALTGISGTVLGLASGLLLGLNINALISALDKIFSFFSWLGLLFSQGTQELSSPILNTAYYLETIPIVLDLPLLAMLGGSAIVLATLFAGWPALRAARFKPLTILRKMG